MTHRCRRTYFILFLLCALLGPGRVGSGMAASPLGPGLQPAALLVEPDQGWRTLVHLIDHAQNSIFVAAYILSDRRVVRALERAAVEGVDVRVMLEPHPFGLVGQPQTVADELRAAGVDVRWSPSGFTYSHDKYLVLDDSTAVVGSANLSRSAFTGNRDFFVVLRSPVEVRQVSNLFREDWDRLPVAVADPNLVVSPLNARADLESLVAEAHRTLQIDGEEMTDPALARELADAVRRGVQVRVLLPDRAALRVPAQGVAIRFLATPYMHAKMFCVDGRLAFVGSENMSATSLDRNRELGVLLEGPVVARLNAVFNRDWHAAHLLRAEAGAYYWARHHGKIGR